MSFFKKNKNTILYSAAGILGIVALVKLFPGKDTSGSGDPVFDKDENTGSGFTPKNVADKLYEAMKGLGTDESAIWEVLTPVSESMFIEVIEAFGIKTYPVLYPPFIAKGDLIHWLKSELSSGEYNRLKQKYPNVL